MFTWIKNIFGIKSYSTEDMMNDISVVSRMEGIVSLMVILRVKYADAADGSPEKQIVDDICGMARDLVASEYEQMSNEVKSLPKPDYISVNGGK